MESADSKLVDLMLREYAVVRAEVLGAMANRNTILTFGLATIGLMFTGFFVAHGQNADLRMPSMGGDELVSTIRERWPPLVSRILLTTGDVATAAADQAIRATGRPCLPKPFNVRELVTMVQRIIDEAERTEEG